MTPETETNGRQHTTVELPDEAVIVLPLRNLVVFPGSVLPITIGRARSVAAAKEAARTERPLGLVLQRDLNVEDPGPADLHGTGTIAKVLRYITAPDESHHVICQGVQRFRTTSYVEDLPFLAARVELYEEPEEGTREIEARLLYLKREAIRVLRLAPFVPPEVIPLVQKMKSASQLADFVTGVLDIEPERKQRVLETFDLDERLDRVASLLAERFQVLSLLEEMSERTQDEIDEHRREYLLREQLRTIQKELGEVDGRRVELEELRASLEEAAMPGEVRTAVERELTRLERMPEAAAEYSMTRTYVDWLIELPWSKESTDALDIAQARAILDEDHYGLDKVKRRILELLAVRSLNPEGKSPILCFVGPPGTGKTSVGRSIARAMGRAFVRVSLGGVHDESEIRGHRRTYVGALPGVIIQQIRQAGTRNPVFMLDEVDKLGVSLHGDPASALLAVLDPEQNATFRDHYVDLPFDLSRVLFITTANMLDTIPPPLRDRCEVLELPGYTEREKLEIARRYLVGRQLEANGLQPTQCEIADDAIRTIVRHYTREAGVRNLEREIGSIFRNVATRVAEGLTTHERIDVEALAPIIGARRFESEVAMRTSVPGVATGLAWTPNGGDVLFVEASRMAGTGRLILTGQLGEVMKESAQAALSLAKSRRIGGDPKTLKTSDIHVHVPAGAIPKDGPSAGLAIYVALVSMLTGRTVRPDVAMTGEISLRGLVLPVGGVKEKALAAVTGEIAEIPLPARNRKDFEEIPEDARDRLRFHWIETVEDAVDVVFAEAEKG